MVTASTAVGTASLMRAGSLTYLNGLKDEDAIKKSAFHVHLFNYANPDKKFVSAGDAEAFRASVRTCMESKWVAYGTEGVPDFAGELKASTTAINHPRRP